jgi:hypothetical protein
MPEKVVPQYDLIFDCPRRDMYANYTTVKPAHAVTSIKQSPVLKGHLCFVMSLFNCFWFDEYSPEQH